MEGRVEVYDLSASVVLGSGAAPPRCMRLCLLRGYFTGSCDVHEVLALLAWLSAKAPGDKVIPPGVNVGAYRNYNVP